MTQEEYVELLYEKKMILSKIVENTERQVRFIRRLALVGLKRLLRERAKLLNELALLVVKEDEGGRWQDEPEIQAICQQIHKLQQMLIAVNALTLRSALAEKKDIADQLSGNAKAREVRQIYLVRWYRGLSRGFSRKA